MKSRKKSYLKRPLALGTLFYILGLIGGEFHSNKMGLALFFLVVFSVTIGFAVCLRNGSLGFYLVFMVLGIGSIVINPTLKQERIFAQNPDAEVRLIGRVIDLKEYDYQNHYIIKPSKESNIKSKIKVQVGKGFETACVGDTIRVTGKMDLLSFPRNPGAFNERTYLLIRGISGKLQAADFTIKQVGGKPSITQRIRAYYGQMFESLMPEKEAQIMKAMLLGDKAFLSKEIQALYSDVGIAHVLAISGLHISVIAGVLWWFLNLIGLKKNHQSILVILMLWFYGGLTGFSVSITRSALMMSVIITGTLIEEKPDPITSWSFAALVLLLYNNLYLWDIGFQLSFVAVGSLILLTPFFEKIYIIPEKIRNYIAPMIAVSLGTTPIIAYYYYLVTPISMVMNLVLVPLITIVVIVGFAAMILGPINILLSKAVIGGAYYLLVLIEKISKLALKIPFSTIIVGRPDPLELGIYGLFIGVILLYLHFNLEERKKFRTYGLGFNMLLLLIFVGKRVAPGDLRVTFLDVGQGDSIVITTPSHKTFIIDGGIAGNGKKIEQFLKYNGIRKVHGAILSHAHADHMDGLGELAQTYKIDKLFLSEVPLKDPHFKAFYDIILWEDIPVHKIREKDIIKDKEIQMECIFPFKDLGPLEGNDASVVLVLKYDMASYYFTGDIEENFERDMAKQICKNQINILKVPHHGSKTSSTQDLISQIDPDLAIISCGKRNIYGHPSPEVVQRYEENKVPIKITKDLGAIMTYSKGKKVKIRTMEDTKLLWK